MPVNIYRRQSNPSDGLAGAIQAAGTAGASVMQAPTQGAANSLAQIKTLMDIQKLQRENQEADPTNTLAMIKAIQNGGAPAAGGGPAKTSFNPSTAFNPGGGVKTIGAAELERQNKLNNVQPEAAPAAAGPSSVGGMQASYSFPLGPKGGRVLLKPPAASSDLKQEQFKDKRKEGLTKALDPSGYRMGALGISKEVFDRSERLESLANAYPDGNLDSRQIEELAIGANAMLSGRSGGSQEQVRNLVPKSIAGDANKFTEWLTNNPRGTEQREFVKRMLQTVQREKKTAEAQINRTRFARIKQFEDLRKSDPDTFEEILQSSGIDPQEYYGWQKGGYKPISAVQGAEDPYAGPPKAQSKYKIVSA